MLPDMHSTKGNQGKDDTTMVDYRGRWSATINTQQCVTLIRQAIVQTMEYHCTLLKGNANRRTSRAALWHMSTAADYLLQQKHKQ